MGNVVLMATIKIPVPDELDEAFRKAASRRHGIKEGALTSAILSAMSKYSGLDPMNALIASASFVSVEAPPNQMSAVLEVLLPRTVITVNSPNGLQRVKEVVGEVDVTYRGRDYVAFTCDPANRGHLPGLGSFRVEWDGKELVFEEDCVSINTASLGEALEIAEKVAKALNLTFPRIKVSKQVEIYRWEGVEGQEVVIK